MCKIVSLIRAHYAEILPFSLVIPFCKSSVPKLVSLKRKHPDYVYGRGEYNSSWNNKYPTYFTIPILKLLMNSLNAVNYLHSTYHHDYRLYFPDIYCHSHNLSHCRHLHYISWSTCLTIKSVRSIAYHILGFIIAITIITALRRHISAPLLILILCRYIIHHAALFRIVSLALGLHP